MKSGLELNGRYVVHGEAGSGGYATVWKASDKQLNREVALKRLLKRGLAGAYDDALALLAEAKKSATLVHPNIVQVYDIISVDDEHLIVMEYVDGQSLATLLRARALSGDLVPLDVGMAIIQDTFSGVAFAHSRQICHRDLSPANVLLTSTGTPKVGDFGLAKILAAPGDSSPLAPNSVQGGTGNLHYMSPEQARGEAADFLSDLFMIGIAAYLLLTGRHPFAHPSGLFDIPELLLREDFNPEVPKSPQSLSATQQRIFREYAAVVMRLLQREKAGRFSSAQEAIDAIESITPTVDCPQCDERNPDHHRFCAFCGFELASIPVRSTAMPTVPTATADELVEEGYRLSQENQWEAAVQCYHIALQREPEHRKAHRNLAFALNRFKRYDEARVAANHGIELGGLLPDHKASLLYERAFAEQNMRRYDEAYGSIQEAILINPRSPKFMYFRARLQEYRGRFAAAKQDARDVLKTVPDHAGALRLLAQYLDSP